MSEAPTRTPGRRRRLLRVAPLLLIPVVLLTAWATGLTDYLTFESLQRRREALEAYRSVHPWLALIGYIVVYIVVVVFSVPGALIMTLTGGMLFGAWLGTGAAVIGASTGATIIFLIARTAIGDGLRKRCGPWLGALIDGFERDAPSYLLSMRLIPGVPFFAVNLAAGLVRMRVSLYVLITVIGILPGSFIYASVGSSLVTVFARGETPNLRIIFEPHVLGPLLGLAALSLAPVLYQRLRRRRS